MSKWLSDLAKDKRIHGEEKHIRTPYSTLKMNDSYVSWFPFGTNSSSIIATLQGTFITDLFDTKFGFKHMYIYRSAFINNNLTHTAFFLVTIFIKTK